MNLSKRGRPLTRCVISLLFLSAAGAFAAQPPDSPENAATSARPALTSKGQTIAADVDNSVVKVFSTMRYADPYKPWTKQGPSEVTASGVVIDGNRILTNAHAVLYATQVQIQANQAGDKILATVVAVAPEIDLAVLKLDDGSFFETHAPVPRGSKLPEIKDAVLAYGFPTGGSSLSITKGIVSRIEFVQYSSAVSGLRIQVDAAINAGNSGGPAIAGDKMIGLAFAKLGGDSQNIGYIIPNEEIELFLLDIADGRYDGKPAMYDELQTLENPALRAFLKLDRSVTGVVVHRPYSSDESYPLRKWDVLTRIADTPIDDQGMIKVGKSLRLGFHYLIQKVATDGKVSLTVVRAGKVMRLELPLHADRPMLIPDLKGAYPAYFIYGPLVFSKATVQFLAFLSNNTGVMNAFSFIKSPLLARRGDAPDVDREELVVIASPFLTHRLSNGYTNPSGAVVASVNGTAVRSLSHLVSLLRDLQDEFVTIELDNRGGETLVFSRKEMVAATDEILTDNGVRAQGSPDTMAIWQARGQK
jgi:S1-C subfamily serine protease